MKTRGEIMCISHKHLGNKIFRIASTIIVILTFILGIDGPVFASLDKQEIPLNESNLISPDLLFESPGILPTTSVIDDSGHQESLTSQENLIDKNRLNYFSLPMPQLDNRVRNILVYLPESYQTGEKSYPVIYIQDAQNIFIRSGVSPDERTLNEDLYKFYASSFPGEVIIVGMEYDQIHMWDEYGPWVNQSMYLWVDSYEANQVEGGEGDAYLDFLVDTVKPEIDRRYRTLTDRENTAIAGSKMGGLISLYAGLTKPEVYSKVVAMSPAIWFAESGRAWLSDNQLISFIEHNGVSDNVNFILDVDPIDRITDLVVRPAIKDANGNKLSFPRAYLEGTQAVVDSLVKVGVSLDHIMGGVDNPAEWTKTKTVSIASLINGDYYFSFFPIVMYPATPPVITSPSSANFIMSSQNSFLVTTIGNPTPIITYAGTLPSGVSFIDNGDGTATISGSPTSIGTYEIIITAQNGFEPNATQVFTLKVFEGCPGPSSCKITFSINMSPYLSRTRNITVYLPPNYNSGAHYPVIYLMDAQHMFGPPIAYPSDLDDWTMDEKLNDFYNDTGRGVIAVGIWFDADYPWDEYTRTSNLNMDHWVSGASQLTSPKGGALINFIREKLKPVIDSRFHTLTDRSNTAIGGGSRCALLALHAGLVAPSTFSRVMAMSPAVWIAEGGSRVELPALTTWFEANGLQAWFDANQAPTNVKYFLYIGTNEQSGIVYPYVQKSDNPGEHITIQYAYLSGALRIRYALYRDGVTSVNYIENEGGEHHPQVWRGYIKQALLWLGF